MENDIRSLLGLQGYRITGVTHAGRDALMAVEPPAEAGCPRCGGLSTRIHARSARPSRLLWAFIDGGRLWLTLHRRRHWCADCRRPFTGRLPGVRPRATMSIAAEVAIMGALRESSFAALTRSHGVSYGRARRILERLPVPWCDWSSLVGAGPISLGIDEHSFRGTELCLQRELSLDRPPRRDPARPTPGDPSGLAPEPPGRGPGPADGRLGSTFNPSYRSVLRAELPGARIVADRFHVIADANRRLDETRRLEGAMAGEVLARWPLVKAEERLTPRQAAQLADLTRRFPTLAEQHWVKERLRDLYRAPDRRTAEARWTDESPCRHGGERRPSDMGLGPDTPALAPRDPRLLRASDHERLHRGLPHEDQAPQTTELRLPKHRGLPA